MLPQLIPNAPVPNAGSVGGARDKNTKRVSERMHGCVQLSPMWYMLERTQGQAPDQQSKLHGVAVGITFRFSVLLQTLGLD